MKIEFLKKQIHIKAVFNRKPTLNIMKKPNFLFICLLFLFAGCEKKFDNVVDYKTVNYQFGAPSVPTSVNYNTNPAISPTIRVTDLPSGSKVWFDVVSLYSADKLTSKAAMEDNGEIQICGDVTANDHIYSGKFSFRSTDYTGDYEMSFYITVIGPGGDEETKKIASKSISFTGLQRNEPPVISDLTMASSVDRNQEFTITLKVTDINGLSDIDNVTFLLTNPGGTTPVGTFFLYDDGSLADITDESGRPKRSGDAIAGDGIFSRKMSFSSTAAIGDWSFLFKAKDLNSATSNTITQTMTLK